MPRTSAVAVVVLLVAALVAGGRVAAANAGDIYVRNVSDAHQPGHQTDPRLGCEDIDLMADRPAHDHGTFTIDGEPPSGSGNQDYPASGGAPWSYPAGGSGTQVVAEIPVQTLIANAQRNGDAPVDVRGYHFRIGLVEDQSRHRTFWVGCQAGTSSTTITSTVSTSSSSASAAAGQSATTTTTTTTRRATTPGRSTASKASSTTAKASSTSAVSSRSSATSTVHPASTTNGGVAAARAQEGSTTSSSSTSGGAVVVPGTGAPRPSGADPGPSFVAGLLLLAAGVGGLLRRRARLRS